MITHALPGRIRLRHSRPPGSEELAQLLRQIGAVAPSATLSHSPRSGTTLIEFTEQTCSGEVLALLQAGSCDRAASAPKRQNGLCCWPSMTAVKRGMTGSLLATLGLAALRREGGHILAGGIFLACLSRHLWVYRRRLWK
ncbi:hypothetical protein [Desulfobulbus sp.]|uniref:hypothetical protein n=1 Tax=Desulfobulbus sp. TaxID=895 RepID=UPI00286EF406|nr:hypothetical protein [Desulfobulbus sp.]